MGHNDDKTENAEADKQIIIEATRGRRGLTHTVESRTGPSPHSSQSNRALSRQSHPEKAIHNWQD